ncbi:MAG: hypothetical protein K8H88_09025 [Sandaracinaceae bacterium]|nr:hypothetical protein [Sandaracinaceae bacterium]
MIVAPDMIQLETALPPVATALGGDRIQLQLGGIVATLEGPGPGPYEGGLRVELAATAVATVQSGSGEDPSFDSIELTELSFGADRVLPPRDRDQVYGFMAILAHHVAGFALNDGGPTLPVPSLQTTAEFVPYGVASGLTFGAQAPQISVVPDHLELIGDFGQITP